MYGAPAPFPAKVALWNFDDGTGLRKVTVPGAKGLPVGALTVTDPAEFSRSDPPGGMDRPVGAFTADSRFFVVAAGDEDRHIHVVDVKKAGVRSSFAVDRPVKGLFPLDSGEVAVVGVEPKAIVIWKIKPP